MPQVAVIRTVRQTYRELKQMNYECEGWESLHEAGRKALKRVIEEHRFCPKQECPRSKTRSGRIRVHACVIPILYSDCIIFIQNKLY